MSTGLVPVEQRPIVHVERDEQVKDYITPAPFVAYGADGEIHTAGSQGVAYTTDAMARGELILLAEIPWSYGLADLAHYVDVEARRVCEKSDCPTVLNHLMLSDLPVPCRIEISNPAGPPSIYDWSDSALVLSFDHPGTYTVRVLSVPYLPATFAVANDG